MRRLLWSQLDRRLGCRLPFAVRRLGFKKQVHRSPQSLQLLTRGEPSEVGKLSVDRLVVRRRLCHGTPELKGALRQWDRSTPAT